MRGRFAGVRRGVRRAGDLLRSAVQDRRYAPRRSIASACCRSRWGAPRPWRRRTVSPPAAIARSSASRSSFAEPLPRLHNGRHRPTEAPAMRPRPAASVSTKPTPSTARQLARRGCSCRIPCNRPKRGVSSPAGQNRFSCSGSITSSASPRARSISNSTPPETAAASPAPASAAPLHPPRRRRAGRRESPRHRRRPKVRARAAVRVR